MQHDCTPEKLAEAALALLRDRTRAAALPARFEQIHASLRRDASARAADAVADLLPSGRG
jgi:lipid-A-disaccharide synthase